MLVYLILALKVLCLDYPDSLNTQLHRWNIVLITRPEEIVFCSDSDTCCKNKNQPWIRDKAYLNPDPENLDPPKRLYDDPLVQSINAQIRKSTGWTALLGIPANIDSDKISIFGCEDTRPILRNIYPDQPAVPQIFVNADDGVTTYFVPRNEVKSISWYWFQCGPTYIQIFELVPAYQGLYEVPADEVRYRTRSRCIPDPKYARKRRQPEEVRLDGRHMCVDSEGDQPIRQRNAPAKRYKIEAFMTSFEKMDICGMDVCQKE